MSADADAVEGTATELAPEAADHAEVYAALLAAQSAVEDVTKASRNQAQGYSYASAEDVMRAARSYLLPERLVLVFSEASRELREVPRKGGGVMVHATVTLQGRLTHVPSITTLVLEVSGEGADVGDKALAKANTSAVKYGLRDLLLLPFGEDADVDTPERGVRDVAAAVQRAAEPTGTCTESQARMLFAKAKAAGLTDDQRRAVLAYAAQVDTEADVPRAKVDAVVAAIAKAYAQLQRPPAPESDFPTPDVPAPDPEGGAADDPEGLPY